MAKVIAKLINSYNFYSNNFFCAFNASIDTINSYLDLEK